MARNYIPLTFEFVEESEELSDIEFGRLIRQGIKYAKAGEPIALNGNERFFAKRLMNQIDRANQSYVEVCEKRKEAGKRGAEVRWQGVLEADGNMANDSKNSKCHFANSKNSQSKSKSEYKSEYRKDTPKPPRKDSDDGDAKQVIDYLNEKTGAKYRYSESSLKHIRARLNDGFSVDDCKSVIDKKTAEWLHDAKMRTYLRPETLFGGKFEGYLNAPMVRPKGEVLPDYWNSNPIRETDQRPATQEEIDLARKALLKGKSHE